MSSPQELRIQAFMSPAFDCPTRHETAAVNILICSTPRSGSMLLSDLFRQTQLLGVPMEYLNQDYVRQWSIRSNCAEKEESIGNYLSEVVRHRTTPNGVFGLKLHYFQMVQAWQRGKFSIVDYFSREKTLWIHLSRHDLAAQAVSLFRATQTNHWLSTDSEHQRQLPEAPNSVGSDDLQGAYSYPDILTLYRFLEREARGWANFFQARSVEPIKVVYEDLASGRASEIVEGVLRLAQIRFGKSIFPDLCEPVIPSIAKQGQGRDLWVQQFRKDLQTQGLQGHYSGWA
jgi:trehalose 2-sulfotransferase